MPVFVVLLIPASFLDSEFFKILATFVALNSLIYATLAVLKVLPKGYRLFRFDGRNRRTQNRSIYPEPDELPAPAESALDHPLSTTTASRHPWHPPHPAP